MAFLALLLRSLLRCKPLMLVAFLDAAASLGRCKTSSFVVFNRWSTFGELETEHVFACGFVVAHGAVERGDSILALRVDVSARGDQSTKNFRESAGGGGHDQRDLNNVITVMHVGAVLQKKFCQGKVAQVNGN